MDVVRHEADTEDWIVDHTGVKRKPFKVMHREVIFYFIFI
jgi:hypothetical protein